MKPENVRRLAKVFGGLGFILIVVNALDYLTGADQISSSATAIGLMFVVVGMALTGRSGEEKISS